MADHDSMREILREAMAAAPASAEPLVEGDATVTVREDVTEPEFKRLMMQMGRKGMIRALSWNYNIRQVGNQSDEQLAHLLWVYKKDADRRRGGPPKTFSAAHESATAAARLPAIVNEEQIAERLVRMSEAAENRYANGGEPKTGDHVSTTIIGGSRKNLTVRKVIPQPSGSTSVVAADRYGATIVLSANRFIKEAVYQEAFEEQITERLVKVSEAMSAPDIEKAVLAYLTRGRGKWIEINNMVRDPSLRSANYAMVLAAVKRLAADRKVKAADGRVLMESRGWENDLADRLVEASEATVTIFSVTVDTDVSTGHVVGGDARTYHFKKRDSAERFAHGKTLWGRPNPPVKKEDVPKRIASQWVIGQ